MSSTNCGCQCKTTEVVTVPSHAVSFDPVNDAPAQGSLLPVVLLLSMVAVSLKKENQRRRYSSLISLNEGDSARAKPAVSFEWRLRLSPGERLFLLFRNQTHPEPERGRCSLPEDCPPSTVSRRPCARSLSSNQRMRANRGALVASRVSGCVRAAGASGSDMWVV